MLEKFKKDGRRLLDLLVLCIKMDAERYVGKMATLDIIDGDKKISTSAVLRRAETMYNVDTYCCSPVPERRYSFMRAGAEHPIYVSMNGPNKVKRVNTQNEIRFEVPLNGILLSSDTEKQINMEHRKR